MNPETIKLIATLVPLLGQGISEITQVIQRLLNEDTDAIKDAQDWIGVSARVDKAVADWNATQAAKKALK